MQDRSNTGDWENPSWLGSIELVLLVWTRSADRIRASGRRTARTGRTHSCTRPTCITAKTTLAKPGPSTHSHKRTLATRKKVEHWSLTTLREKLLKIGAKVVSHGRYVTFQLAEMEFPWRWNVNTIAMDLKAIRET